MRGAVVHNGIYRLERAKIALDFAGLVTVFFLLVEVFAASKGHGQVGLDANAEQFPIRISEMKSAGTDTESLRIAARSLFGRTLQRTTSLRRILQVILHFL